MTGSQLGEAGGQKLFAYLRERSSARFEKAYIKTKNPLLVWYVWHLYRSRAPRELPPNWVLNYFDRAAEVLGRTAISGDISGKPSLLAGDILSFKSPKGRGGNPFAQFRQLQDLTIATDMIAFHMIITGCNQEDAIAQTAVDLRVPVKTLKPKLVKHCKRYGYSLPTRKNLNLAPK